MSFGDTPSHNENLQGKGQQQALQAMIRGSADTYASMLNVALFPFRLYQQSLAMATQMTLDSLQAATGVAHQGTSGSSRPARRSVEAARSDSRLPSKALPRTSPRIGPFGRVLRWVAILFGKI